MRKKKRYAKHGKETRKIMRKIGILFFCFFLLFLWADWNIRPLVEDFALMQTKIIASMAANDAVCQRLDQEKDLCDKLVQIQYDEKGNVCSLQIDTVTAEMLQEDIASAVEEEIAALREKDVAIPLGTVLGIQILNGKGPSIHFSILPASYVQTNLESEFEACGINQIQHRVKMHLTVSVVVFTPGFSKEVEVDSYIVLAETVIVGDVPQWYGDNQQVIKEDV